MAEGREAVDFHPSNYKKSRNTASRSFTLEGESPKAVVFQNAYMAIFFYQCDVLSKEGWVGQEWKPKLW